MIPDLTLRGMAIMGGLALVLLFLFLPRAAAAGPRLGLDGRMFFLGAGFMLVETKAVVHMALLFGSTWMVNSVVFFAVLVMILAANLFVLRVRPRTLWPYYVGLFVALVLNAWCRSISSWACRGRCRWAASCLLVFAPILFAGVIFAVSFARTDEPDRAFGANIAGAMLGGLAEIHLDAARLPVPGPGGLAFYALSGPALPSAGPGSAGRRYRRRRGRSARRRDAHRSSLPGYAGGLVGLGKWPMLAGEPAPPGQTGSSPVPGPPLAPDGRAA